NGMGRLMNSAASSGGGGFGGRFVLCIPHGGLNDTLCEIERCWDYCIKYERVLLVDTRNTGLMGEMGDFFRPRSQHGDVRFFSGEWSVDDLNRLSCIPSSLQGRIYKYQVMRSF